MIAPGVLAQQALLGAGALPASNIIGVALISSGGGGGTWIHVDADGNTIATPDAAYFNAHPVWGAIQDTTIDSQAMVAIPKFYVRRGVIASGANAGKEAWWIADQPTAGFRLHSAFRNAGSDINQFYVGKYQASVQSAKLASVPGVNPAVSRSLVQFRSDATARNVSGQAGWMLWSAFQLSAIQWLYLVEQATMNSQSRTGQGRVSQTSAASVDASDVAQATYRGVVGLWGNVWQWIDGLAASSGVVNLWDQDGNKSFVSTGVTRTAAPGIIYPTTFMDGSGAGWDLEDVFLGDTGPTSNSNATAPDANSIGTTGTVFGFVGGLWSFGAGAGLWAISLGSTSGTSDVAIGARLAKV